MIEKGFGYSTVRGRRRFLKFTRNYFWMQFYSSEVLSVFCYTQVNMNFEQEK